VVDDRSQERQTWEGDVSMSQQELPFDRAKDQRLEVYRPYIGRVVLVMIRKSRDKDYPIQGKLAQLIQPPGDTSCFVIENESGPQLVPLNMIVPGSFRVTLKESVKKESVKK
jgi:hypothetical protein